MAALPLPDKTTSQSTRLPKDDNQVAGYNPASEKLLDGHPKDAGQVIDETTSHLTKAASCQVIGYGYSQSTKPPKYDGKVAGYNPAKSFA